MSTSIDKPVNNNPKIISVYVTLNLSVENRAISIINLWSVNFYIEDKIIYNNVFPAGIYMFKVNNRTQGQGLKYDQS